MKRYIRHSLCAALATIALGCQSPLVYQGNRAPYAPDSGHHDLWDAIFRRRHADHKAPVAGDPMLVAARELTMLEDDVRRDGSIAVKTPDVWGDANLVSAIQEYESIMKANLGERFAETLQAYIARSDQAELHSMTTLSNGLSGGEAPKPGENGEVKETDVNNVTINGDITQPELFDLIGKAVEAAPPGVDGIGVEPTELDRQRSTFLHANQALRRRMIGDDNSRAAGYGLYLFRIPVSVIPGRETTEGYSAVASFRAQLQIEPTHLRNTFPKLVIADLVEGLTPRVMAEWDHAVEMRKQITALRLQVEQHNVAISPEMERQLKTSSYADRIRLLNEMLKNCAPVEILDQQAKAFVPQRGQLMHPQFHMNETAVGSQSIPSGAPYTSQPDVYGDAVIDSLVDEVVEHIETLPDSLALNPPKPEEVRRVIDGLLGQTHNVLLENHVYENNAVIISHAGDHFVRGQYDWVVRQRDAWFESIREYCLDEPFETASWLLALQSGILDRNLKKILDDLERNGKLAAGQCAAVEGVGFFTTSDPEAIRLWDLIVRETFPLHVFTLDPIVEEQNAYDAFSRRREMQLALAYSVATGSVFTANQKLQMSRALALDEATIALNRTAVGFAHGDDTFGWYFHPRIQTPPTESSNIGALARTIWSTGPTEHYDRKNRRLEPGIRECEVLIAMPSFVTGVSFDVTTNWEKLTRPGVTKRSYEEMLAQGSRLQRLRMCLQNPGNQQCYRPGDYPRLLSRIDQLETMLGMQTYTVNVPYQYDQTGSGLFDTGKRQQRPWIDYYYGLSFLDSAQPQVDFFITGKNFHPTLTHVIVGGVEKHLNANPDQEADVEVISRELLRVRVAGLNPNVTRNGFFEVRVGTPAGLSNPVVIGEYAAVAPPVPAPYVWKHPVNYTGFLCVDACGVNRVHVEGLPDLHMAPNANIAIPQGGAISFDVSVTFKSGLTRTLPAINLIPVTGLTVPACRFQEELNKSVGDPVGGIKATEEREGIITCIPYFFPDAWAPERLPAPVTIELKLLPGDLPLCGPGCPTALLPAPAPPAPVAPAGPNIVPDPTPSAPQQSPAPGTEPAQPASSSGQSTSGAALQKFLQATPVHYRPLSN